MRPRPALAMLAVTAAATAGCGTTEPPAQLPTSTPRAAAAPPAAAAPAAPAAAGTLAGIADVPAARRRLGYVNVPALARLLPPRDARDATRRVLGPRAGAPLPRAGSGVATAVQVAGVAVRHHAPGDAGRVVEGDGPLAVALARSEPARSVIQPVAPAAVQACLGDAATETILGAEALGAGSALGVGLRAGADAPRGLKLVICLSPRYRRQLYGAIRRMEARFGRPDPADPRAPVIGENEIGEQQIAQAIVPADRLSRARLLAYLAGGTALRSLLPAPPRS